MINVLRNKTFVLAVILAFCSSTMNAQLSAPQVANGASGAPTWGTWVWTISQGNGPGSSPPTTDFQSEFDFNVAPPGNSFSTTASLPIATYVHEIHGTAQFGAAPASGCVVGSVIADLKDQVGNTLASVWIESMANDSSYVNIGVKGTFATPIYLTQLSVNFYSSQCYHTVMSWDLVMS